MSREELIDTLPAGLCCFALSRLETPVAVKASDGRFVWANNSFEEMIGYSMPELKVRKWRDVTYHEDIGAEEATLESIRSGEVNCCSLTKTYRNKSGNAVRRQLKIWRWPKDTDADVELLIVEASVEACTIDDLREVSNRINTRLDQVENMARKSVRRDTTIGNVVNSDRVVIVGFVAVMFLICIVGFLGYYLFAKPGQIAPPHVPGVEVVK